MPFNDAAVNVALDALDESATQITHVAICTLSDPGTGTNMNAVEATGGSPAYARQAVTWGAAASRLKSNTGALTFEFSGTYFINFYTYISSKSVRGFLVFFSRISKSRAQWQKTDKNV